MPSLQESLFSFPSAEQVPILALSGGGGKTTALFGLADELSARGARVLVTTTTRIRDPRAEGRGFDRFLEIPGAYATSEATAAVPLAAGLAADPAAAAPPGQPLPAVGDSARFTCGDSAQPLRVHVEAAHAATTGVDGSRSEE